MNWVIISRTDIISPYSRAHSRNLRDRCQSSTVEWNLSALDVYFICVRKHMKVPNERECLWSYQPSAIGCKRGENVERAPGGRPFSLRPIRRHIVSPQVRRPNTSNICWNMVVRRNFANWRCHCGVHPYIGRNSIGVFLECLGRQRIRDGYMRSDADSGGEAWTRHPASFPCTTSVGCP